MFGRGFGDTRTPMTFGDDEDADKCDRVHPIATIEDHFPTDPLSQYPRNITGGVFDSAVGHYEAIFPILIRSVGLGVTSKTAELKIFFLEKDSATRAGDRLPIDRTLFSSMFLHMPLLEWKLPASSREASDARFSVRTSEISDPTRGFLNSGGPNMAVPEMGEYVSAVYSECSR
ncbi:hypothetical protein BD410DRAFT_807333 [Rickenella mellea]|uniref:Uncharacterized protein n=1 Tax=Rickenella mellea TaxID=50990 RepID=A0A4Y7PQR6_9AGAM|nr:hypothetical protein BD410DRAFT_807333 [Rickenella mellea]